MLSLVAIRNEWRLLRRHPMIWIALIGVAGFSLLVAKGSPSDPGATAGEALLRLNLFIPAFMLPFAAGALAPSAFLRENEWNLAEVIGSYPIDPRQWLAARLGHLVMMLAAACALAEVMFVVVLAGQYPGSGWSLASQALLWLIAMQLPACLLWASALAWLASRKANAGMLYVAAGFGWIAYLGLVMMTGTPLIAGSITAWAPLKQAMLLLDPYGGTTLITPVPDTGPLQWRVLNFGVGRLIWLAVALWLVNKARTLPMLAARGEQPAAADVKQTAARAAYARPGHVALHLRYIVRDRVFALLVLGWIALMLPEVIGGLTYAEPLAQVAADSRDALNRVVWDVLPLAGGLLLIYAADRLCRLYQTSGMEALYGATAHRPWALITTQLLSMALIALGSVALTGLAVAVAQLMARSPIDAGEYALQLGLAWLPLSLFGALFVAVHALLRSRMLANLLCLLLLVVGQSSLAPALGLEHPLWRIMATPLAPPDHFWGFARGIGAHVTFLGFWFTLVLAVLAFAVARGHRGQSTPQRRMAASLRHPATIAAVVLAGLAGWQGMDINERLRAEGALASSDERIAARADYERRYARWAAIAQPDVEAIRAQVDFFPEAGRAEVRASLKLINRSSQVIDRLLVGAGPAAISADVAVDGAIRVQHDERLGQTVFRLTAPMQPGERRELDYRTVISRSGLQSPTFPLTLEDQFSSLPGTAILPVTGFRREWTLRDPLLRREQGLPPLALRAPSGLEPFAPVPLARDQVAVEAVISTSAGHYAIGQGRLLHRWASGGRNHFHYRTDQPIRNAVAFLSLAGAPQRWPAGRVTIWTHTPQPLSARNANIIAARDTLALLGREVAPYPGTDLHLIAIPEIGPSGYALPHIIQLSHRLAIRARPERGAGFNQAYRRAAHETAHQWFGHLLGHGALEDRAFLIESLAKYAELVAIDRRFGRAATAALVAHERDRYRSARLDPDRAIAPLIDAEESEDMYARATLSFACLRRHVGDAPILAALQNIARSSRAQDRPATSLAFVRTLQASLPAEQARMVDMLFLSRRPIEAVERDLRCRDEGQ